MRSLGLLGQRFIFLRSASESPLQNGNEPTIATHSIVAVYAVFCNLKLR